MSDDLALTFWERTGQQRMYDRLGEGEMVRRHLVRWKVSILDVFENKAYVFRLE